jgi:hypothetical protein
MLDAKLKTSTAKENAHASSCMCTAKSLETKRSIYLEHSCNVAGAKDPLHAGVSLRIRRREVGGEDAVLGAPPALVLARGAPPDARAGSSSSFRARARRHDLAGDLFAERGRRFAGRFRGSSEDAGCGERCCVYV